MKLKYLFIAIIAVVLSSCSGESPEKVVQEFFLAIDAKDYEKAKSLATVESESTIDMMKNVGKVTGFLGKFLPKELSNNISIVECEVKENNGNCKCWGEGKVNEKEVAVKKVEGVWKVDMSIQNITGTDIDISEMKEVMESVDMEKVMEAFAENSDSINKVFDEVGDEFKEVAIEAIDAIEENLDEVKENLQK